MHMHIAGRTRLLLGGLVCAAVPSACCRHEDLNMGGSFMNRGLHRGLWVVQAFLALFLGFASAVPKLFVPPDLLPPMPIPLPQAFIVFIGVAELLGALGLILPGLTGIRPGLTPLAAAGLLLICIGATAYQFAASEPGNAVFAIGIGLLCAFVAYGRWQLVPHNSRSQAPTLEPAH